MADLHLFNLLSGVDDEYNKDVFLQDLPHGDREFIVQYLKFIHSKNPPAFMPISIICIIFGLVGNTLFCFFFGNKSSRVYHTRDAMFFRRMSAVDMMICAFVLPYGIFFEAKMVTNNTACKSLEFSRHVLTNMSHIFMTYYSMRFATKENYFVLRKSVNLAMGVIAVIAIIISLPVIFIFEVDSKFDFNSLLQEDTKMAEHLVLFPIPVAAGEFDQILGRGPLYSRNRYQFFKPNFCHMNLNFDTSASNFLIVKYLQSVYLTVNTIIYFISATVIIASVIKFLNSKPLLGRSSKFVKIIESSNPQLSEKLEQIKEAKKKKRRLHQQRKLEKRVLQASKNFSQEVDKTRTQNNESVVSAETSVVTGSANESTVTTLSMLRAMKRPYRPDPTDESLGSKMSSQRRTSFKKSKMQISDIVVFSNDKFSFKVGESSVDPVKPEIIQENISWTTALRKDESSVTIKQVDIGISFVAFLYTCACFKSMPPKITRLGGRDIAVVLKSYKTAILVLIMIDLFMVSVAAVGYVITDQISAILNVMYFKNVFAFYIVSFIHAELYKAMWAKYTPNQSSSADDIELQS